MAPVHTDEVDRAVARHRGCCPKRLGQERAEPLVAHLARRHRELAVPALRIGVAVDLHIVRRVEERRVDLRALANHATKEVGIATVAATDAMLAQHPDVAGLRARVRGHRRNDLVIGIGAAVQQHVDLAGREPRDAQVHIDVDRGQLAELDLQQIDVPARALRDLVVGEPQRPLLRVAEPDEFDGRNLGHAHRLGGEQPAVAGNDRVVRIDQNRDW